MKLIQTFLMVVTALVLISCSSPQERVYEAEEEIHRERLELIEKYQDCMKDSGGDKVKAGTCDHYLKAADALK